MIAVAFCVIIIIPPFHKPGCDKDAVMIQKCAAADVDLGDRLDITITVDEFKVKRNAVTGAVESGIEGQYIIVTAGTNKDALTTVFDFPATDQLPRVPDGSYRDNIDAIFLQVVKPKLMKL
jgi:hypothetical protein